MQLLLVLQNTKMCVRDLDLMLDHPTNSRNLTSIDVVGISYLFRIVVVTINNFYILNHILF